MRICITVIPPSPPLPSLLKDNRVGTASFVVLLFVLLNPIAACIINNETLLSDVFNTHTDIVSVWWIN